jgi:hypothetical protein
VSTEGSLVGIMWLGCEADYSSPSTAEDENGGARPPPLHVFMA